MLDQLKPFQAVFRIIMDYNRPEMCELVFNITLRQGDIAQMQESSRIYLLNYKYPTYMSTEKHILLKK